MIMCCRRIHMGIRREPMNDDNWEVRYAIPDRCSRVHSDPSLSAHGSQLSFCYQWDVRWKVLCISKLGGSLFFSSAQRDWTSLFRCENVHRNVQGLFEEVSLTCVADRHSQHTRAWESFFEARAHPYMVIRVFGWWRFLIWRVCPLDGILFDLFKFFQKKSVQLCIGLHVFRGNVCCSLISFLTCQQTPRHLALTQLANCLPMIFSPAQQRSAGLAGHCALTQVHIRCHSRK